jgi:hypothetical protein
VADKKKENKLLANLPVVPATDAGLRRVQEIRDQERQARKGSGSKPKPVARKERVTLHATPELADRMRRAAYWLPGVTIASLCEAALTAELARLERAHGSLEPIPPGESVPTGRPVKRPR